MSELFNFKDKSFAVYGLGLTGKSVIKFLKKNKVKKTIIWDDHLFNLNIKLRKKFKDNLDLVDHIIISPGININNSILKKKLLKNKKKLLTDLDLFFLKNNLKRSIVITGTNGKSTTCSLIHHIFIKNKIKSQLAGNIGKPILDIKFIKNEIYIIEASSFQLENSKFVRPYCAAILNITKDHLDWHGTEKNYIKSKFKIFKNQKNSDFAFINDTKLKKIFRKNKFLGKLNFIEKNPLKINQIQNNYLKLQSNKDNIAFAFHISKKFKIKKLNFLNSLKSFKGLNHRQELFLKIKNHIFINDSKATSFEATRYALKSNDNIIWILGGKPKENDKIRINKFKKKIIMAYIIGKHPNFFSKQINKNIKYEIYKNLKIVIKKIFQSLKYHKKTTILFSPASASYDQFKNFVQRGEKFKKLIKYYAKKSF
tara:strand:- start:313 stop:1587 length:1275 start_codon:yes stop_codon:yes gene_type:complete